MSHPPPSFRRLVYPLAATVGVAFGAILYGFSVLITEAGAGGEFSTTTLSTAFAGSVLTGGAVTIPVGRWADRHGVRGILALGAALVAVGFGGFALATEPWHVLAAWWLLVGPGSAMVLFDPAFVALQQWFHRADRNRAAGTLTLLTGLAGPVFVPATTAVQQTLGWRPAAALLGTLVAVVGWVAAGPLLAGAPRPPAASGASASEPTREPIGPVSEPRGGWPSPVRQLSRRPAFLLLTLSVLLAMGSLEAVQVHRLARFEATGFDPAVLAGWAAAASLLSLPGRFVMPRLATRLGGWPVLAVCTALLVPALALAVRGTTTWEMAGHFTLFGLAFGATIPLRTVVMSDWYAGPRFGALMGVQALALSLGRAGAPAVVGWLRDVTGTYAPGMGLLLAFVAVSALLVVAAARAHRRDPT